TDLVALDERTGRMAVGKVSSTPRDPSRGVLEAVGAAGLDPAEIVAFLHGCTVVINAITERKGVRTALVTTAGFRDVLEIGRGNRPDMYNLLYHKPPPFVPRHLRFEVRERVGWDGTVYVPLHLEDLEPIAEACRREEVEALAICFLHAYAHPAHEEECRTRLLELLPGVYISRSSDVTREWREFERSSTTVLNAYVGPIVDDYLAGLEGRLTAAGLEGGIFVMQSNGGMASLDLARRVPIQLVESGPAAGIIGAAELGRLIGEDNVIYLDIGGTTAKCSLVQGGQPKVSTEYRLEQRPDYAGYPAMVPVVDIVEIGAGGGSIAWVDRTGGLHVGPRSAGADPGPACYGRGGEEPTVTDAELVAGVLNPDYFLGGRLQVEPELSWRAVARIAEAAGSEIPAAAIGIVKLVNANMINALKLVSVRRGYDPRDFVLVACGGGGAMHAAALGDELRVKEVVIPQLPGHFSALGMLAASPQADIVQTRITRLDSTSAGALEELFSVLEQQAAARVRQEGESTAELTLRRAVDIRYAGQEHTVRVAVEETPIDIGLLERRFHEEHRRAYTFQLPSTPVELVTFHATATVKLRPLRWRELEADGHAGDEARKGRRDVQFADVGRLSTPVYERGLLPPGFAVQGPVIVEEPASTTLVHLGQRLAVDRFGNLRIGVD
ncbi:MAG TPA: hydantoinase/oxoprolinase family protein, partial [Candidatus Sulfotelmatobacter sp.]|nr:hydantoinase/oxoprolinase family protein [Candidatus Sulfotelmatobacter sp.]